jgi:polyisoprenoid-binding protein YceI
MDKKYYLIAASLAVFLFITGFFVFDAVLGETEEASAPIAAVPLEIDNSTEEEAQPDTSQPAAESESTQPETAAPEEAQQAAAGSTIYTISQDQSQASFTLSEVLRGSPTTVLGTTDQVPGEIAVDLNDLSTVQVGTIQVNARTLETDESRRNQAIRNRILNTDSYEFISFVPTEVVGLSGSASPGQTLTFQIVGDLTIRDITQPVTFEVTAEINDVGQLLASAVTTITRAQYDLTIPSVPFVADVGEEVTINLNIVALTS